MLFPPFLLLLSTAAPSETVANPGTVANADSRAGQIEAERLEKAGALEPPSPDRLEKAVIRIENNVIVKWLMNT